MGTLDIRLSSTGHPRVAIPRLCWVSLSGLFRAARGPTGSCGRHSPHPGVSLLPLVALPPIFLLPPSPCPLIPLQACSFPGPGSCWTQGLLHSASSVKPPQTAPPASPGQGGPGAGGWSFQGLEGKDPSQRLAPTSAHQDPQQPCWNRKWVWGMFAWGHQTLIGRMGT